MSCALIPAPCNFSLPSHSFLLLLHLTVAPSSLYHYRFLLSFSFFTTFSIQDRPFTLSRQSITLISAAYCYHFIPTLFSRTPFGTYSTRAHTRKSTIHSFILQLRPAKILHYKNKNPTDSRQICAKIFGIYIRFPNNPTTLHTDSLCVLFGHLPAQSSLLKNPPRPSANMQADELILAESETSTPSPAASMANSTTPATSTSSASRRPPRKSTLTQQQKNQKRQRATQDQLVTLEIEFSKNATPTAAVRERIAQEINMTERSVQIWFQNRYAQEILLAWRNM